MRGLSIVLTVLGGFALLTGAIAAHGRVQIVDRENFADNSVEALQGEGVRRAIRREIGASLIGGESAEVQADVEAVLDDVIQSDPFQSVFRAAALELHRIFFERETTATLDLREAEPLVDEALRNGPAGLEPLANEQFEASVLTLRREKLAGEALAAAERLRVLGLLLPLVALVAFAGALLVAPSRSTALLGIGVTGVIVGAIVAVIVPLTRAALVDRLGGTPNLSADQIRAAGTDVFDAFVGGLLVWGLAIALAGAALIGAALVLRSRAGGDVLEPASI